MKQKQAQVQQAQVQQAQNQLAQTQAKTQAGGAEMEQKLQNQQQGGVYFITFAHKVDPEKAKEVLAVLRNRFPGMSPVFIARPPRGRRLVTEINGITIILTFPYSSKRTNKEQTPQDGFTIRELLGNKKV